MAGPDTAARTARGGTTRHIVVAHLMPTRPWPIAITEMPAAAPCRKDRRPPGRMQAISMEANSEAETRRQVVARRMRIVEPAVVVTVSETARFQARAQAQEAAALFPVLPAGAQPAP